MLHKGLKLYIVCFPRDLNYILYVSPGNESQSTTPIIGPADTITETMSIDIKDVCAFFEVENMDQSVPLLCVRTSVEAKVSNWTKQVDKRFDLV